MNWLRAKARYVRWEEEVNLIRHEMEWTVNYFKYRKREWEDRVGVSGVDSRVAEGLQSYAEKQVGLWNKFSENAIATFNAEVKDLKLS